jgi:hypothetical protein
LGSACGRMLPAESPDSEGTGLSSLTSRQESADRSPAGVSTTASEELDHLASPTPATDTNGAIRQRITAVHADRLTPCGALSAQVSAEVDEAGGHVDESGDGVSQPQSIQTTTSWPRLPLT